MLKPKHDDYNTNLAHRCTRKAVTIITSTLHPAEFLLKWNHLGQFLLSGVRGNPSSNPSPPHWKPLCPPSVLLYARQKLLQLHSEGLPCLSVPSVAPVMGQLGCVCVCVYCVHTCVYV